MRRKPVNEESDSLDRDRILALVERIPHCFAEPGLLGKSQKSPLLPIRKFSGAARRVLGNDPPPLRPLKDRAEHSHRARRDAPGRR